jgi:hypothetical protein
LQIDLTPAGHTQAIHAGKQLKTLVGDETIEVGSDSCSPLLTPVASLLTCAVVRVAIHTHHADLLGGSEGLWRQPQQAAPVSQHVSPASGAGLRQLPRPARHEDTYGRPQQIRPLLVSLPGGRERGGCVRSSGELHLAHLSENGRAEQEGGLQEEGEGPIELRAGDARADDAVIPDALSQLVGGG